MKLNKSDKALLEAVLGEYLNSPIKTKQILRGGIARLGEIKRELAGEIIPELKCSKEDLKRFGKEIEEEYFAESDKIIKFHINRD